MDNTGIRRKGGHRCVLLFILMLGVFVQFADAQKGKGESGGTLQVQGQNDMMFGDVVAGEVVTIDAQSNDAARFHIVNTSSSDMMVTVDTPNNLRKVGGNAEMPIAFDGQSGAWAYAKNQQTPSYFDPAQVLVIDGSNAGWDNSVFVWLGAMLSVPANQASGDYEGIITLTVTTLD